MSAAAAARKFYNIQHSPALRTVTSISLSICRLLLNFGRPIICDKNDDDDDVSELDMVYSGIPGLTHKIPRLPALMVNCPIITSLHLLNSLSAGPLK